MRYILDTDIISLLQRGNPKIEKKLENPNNQYAISIVTRAEILRGRIAPLLKAENSERLETSQFWLVESEKLLSKFPIIQFDNTSLEKFDELRQKSKFRKIGRNDTLIASICLANQATLVSRNLKHFKQFPNLKVENWLDK